MFVLYFFFFCLFRRAKRAEFVSRAKRAGLDLPKGEQLDDDALEALNRALNQFAIYFENRLPV